MAWLQLDMSVPRREDYYAAQTAYEIRRANAAQPKDVKREHLLIKFKEKGVEKMNEEETTISEERNQQEQEDTKKYMDAEKIMQSQIAKARWTSMMTVPIQVMENGSN